MRAGVAVVIACAASAAEAAPRVEASGFVGVDWFGARNELGNSWAADQVPGTASLVGARASWLACPALPGRLQLALEGELAVAPAFTGDHAAAGRRSYFAPVLAWRAHALLRLARWREIEPHVVLGGGGETVVSSSPFMSKESDPVVYWGAGARVWVSRGWYVRLDARHGAMPARDGGMTSTVELQLGLGTAFGGAPEPPRVIAPAPDRDRDGDGIVDRLDACPTEAENRNGVADDDGCPEADPDGDGLVGDADRCADEPEDVDGWQDGDGCPDPDNDGDGIADQLDGCPGDAETVNGWQDGDGCPDALPADVAAALATAPRFAPGRARVTRATGLAPVLAILQRHAELRLVIRGRGGDLARRRAEAVKWALVDQGVAEDRITTVIEADGGAALTFELAR